MENLDNLNIIVQDSKLKNNNTAIDNKDTLKYTLKKNINPISKDNKLIKPQENDYKDILWLTAC